jgi:hypothetical protein
VNARYTIHADGRVIGSAVDARDAQRQAHTHCLATGCRKVEILGARGGTIRVLEHDGRTMKELS